MMMKMLNSLGIMELIIWIVLSPAATATSKITKTETRNKEFGVQRKREYSTFYLYFLSGSYTFVYGKILIHITTHLYYVFLGAQ